MCAAEPRSWKFHLFTSYTGGFAKDFKKLVAPAEKKLQGNLELVARVKDTADCLMKETNFGRPS